MVLEYIKRAFSLIWELPQNILGALLYAVCFFASFFCVEAKKNDIDVYSDIIWGNVSLGCFNFFKYRFFFFCCTDFDIHFQRSRNIETLSYVTQRLNRFEN